MASTLYSDNYRSSPAYSASMAGLKICREFKFTITAAFVINDVLKMAPIPAGVILDDFFVDVPDLDTSTGVTLDYGDNDTANLFINASTVGQSAGKVNGMVTAIAAKLPKKYSAANSFNVKVSAAASGTAATSGSFIGYIEYHYYSSTPL